MSGPTPPNPQDPGLQYPPPGAPQAPPQYTPFAPQPQSGFQQPGVAHPGPGGHAVFGDVGRDYPGLAPANTAVNPRLVPFLGATAAVAFVVFVAAFLPWVSFDGGSVSGAQGGGDGVFTLIVAVIAGAVAAAAIFLTARQQMLPRIAGIVSVVVGVIVTLIAIVDISSVGDSQVTGFGFVFDFSVGFGLWLTLVGGLAFIAVGIATLVVERRH